MPILPQNLRVGIATDASWANANDRDRLEDHRNDFWEETESFWIRYHKIPRRTLFHPGPVEGPDLHDLLPVRKIVRDQGKVSEDLWNKSDNFQLEHAEWIGKIYFMK